jgi:plasmid maintenance system antidote protein VapI
MKLINRKVLKSKQSLYGDTDAVLAEALGITAQTFSLKVNGKADFTAGEILSVRNRYSLTDEEVTQIFFASDVS